MSPRAHCGWCRAPCALRPLSFGFRRRRDRSYSAPRSVVTRIEIGPSTASLSRLTFSHEIDGATVDLIRECQSGRSPVDAGAALPLVVGPDRFRRGSGPISSRNRTDLEPEPDRSRAGVRPISTRNRTDLGALTSLCISDASAVHANPEVTLFALSGARPYGADEFSCGLCGAVAAARQGFSKRPCATWCRMCSCPPHSGARRPKVMRKGQFDDVQDYPAV